MPHLFLFLPLFVFSLSAGTAAVAQDHDIAGYYLDLRGDTIRGVFVNYPELTRSPLAIDFRVAGSGELKSLTPATCSRAVVGDRDVYVSFKGQRLANSTEWRSDPGKGGETFEDIFSFLRVLYDDGHYRLYEFRDKKRSNFYVSADTIQLKELYFRAYTREGQVMEDGRFRRQLNLIFINELVQRPALMRKLEKLNYDGDHLKGFFMEAVTGVHKQVRQRYPVELFVGGGVDLNRFKVGGIHGLTSNIIGTYSSSVSPLVEAGLRIHAQRNYGRLFFMFRVQGYHYTNEGDASTPDGGSNHARFKATVIGFPASAGYRVYQSGAASLDLSAGVSGMFLLSNRLSILHHPGDTLTNSDNLATTTYSVFGEAELHAGRRLSFTLGYFLPATVAYMNYYQPQVSSIRAGLRVRLL